MVAEDVALERFQKLHPLKFDGETDVEKTERWRETLEDIYTAIEYTEKRKVKVAVFQLEGVARAWWWIIDQKWRAEGKPHTWSNFLEEFKSKFIPLGIRDRKEEAFMKLRQKL